MSVPGRTFVASAIVAARFLPIWLATAVLAIVAAIFAPDALQHTSWAYVLPYMTILAVAALGQMLVVMQAGIDLSTPGVISFGGNLIVGVSVGSNHRLALGILACIGLGAAVGLVNGMLVGIVRLNPLIVTLAVGQIVFAWNLRYSREVTNSSAGAGGALVVGGAEASRHQRRLLDGRRDHARRRVRASLHGCRAALPGGGREPESRVDGRAARPDARRVRVHGGRHPLRRRRDPARRHPHQHRPRLRLRLPARADRRRRHRRRFALRRTGERDVDVDGGARAHVADADAADPRPVDGDAVHRLRRCDHRRDAGLRRPGRVAARPCPTADRGAGRQPPWQSNETRAEAHERRHDARTDGVHRHDGRRPMVVVLHARAARGGARARLDQPRQHGQRRPQPRAPATIGKGGGFGEVYEAKASHPEEDAVQGHAAPEEPDGAQHRAGRSRPRRQEGQLRPGAQVLEEQRLQHRDEGQAHRRLHRAVRRERLPPDVEDGVHPPGADVSRRRQDHLQERPLGSQPGDRRLQGGDRTARQPDRHLSGLRRRDAAGHEGGDRRRNPGGDLRLGLRDRAGQELPDGRR